MAFGCSLMSVRFFVFVIYNNSGSLRCYLYPFLNSLALVFRLSGLNRQLEAFGTALSVSFLQFRVMSKCSLLYIYTFVVVRRVVLEAVWFGLESSSEVLVFIRAFLIN